MSENGWTEGPWWISGKGTIRAVADGKWIARVYHGEQEANARLIAASPALAEALEAMRTWLGVVADKIDLDPDETRVTINAVSPNGVREVAARSLRDIYEQADAALNLAKGRTA